jgi:glycolate oxidase FAD binding subunit
MNASSDATLSDLRERVTAAHRERKPLRLRGGGTKDFYGESIDGNLVAGDLIAGDLVDLRAYRGFVDYEPSELVVTARCGTRLAEIEAALAERGQFLAFEPPAFGGDSTIGGVIAAGLSGPRRMYAGAARDFVLGATLLDARGDLLRFGGQVMKNVAGFDVSRLLCGSLGILGIITEVSLKVLPRPRAEETLRFELSQQAAIEAFNRWSGQPLPISGAAWSAGTAYLRLSGAASAVRAAHERLGGERLETTFATQWWNSLRHCNHAIFNNSSLWRLSLPDTTPPLHLAGDVLIDWGGALRWYGDDSGDADTQTRNSVAHESAVRRTNGQNKEARNIASAAGGTAIRWRGPAPPTGRLHPLQPAVATLHRRLKDRFDPHGIFNPGRLVPGI